VYGSSRRARGKRINRREGNKKGIDGKGAGDEEGEKEESGKGGDDR